MNVKVYILMTTIYFLAVCQGQDSGCCEPETPCDVGEGDCDEDRDCKGLLICGVDNCPWGGNDNCCMKGNGMS